MTTEPTTPPLDPAFAGVKTSDLMRQGLDLTAREATAKAALAEVRAELAARARAEVAASGVVPTWRVTGLGRAQLTDPQPQVKVTDAAALASWAAQREGLREHVTATITIPAVDLERALEALEDAAVEAIKPASVDLALAGKRQTELLEQVGTIREVGEELTEPAPVFVESGEVVDGVALVPAAARVFSLVLDAEAKRRAIAEGQSQLRPVDGASTRPAEHDGWGGGIPAADPVRDAVLAGDGQWHDLPPQDDAEGEPEYTEDLPVEEPPAPVQAPAHELAVEGEERVFLRQLAEKDLNAQPVGTLKAWAAAGGVQVNDRAPKPVFVKALAAAIAEAQATEHAAQPTS